MTKLKIISSDKELSRLIKYCKKTKYASIDFEAPLKYYDEQCEPWILGVSFQPGSGWVIPLEHPESPWKNGKWKKRLMKFGKEVLENPDIIKVAWNLKFENKWLMRYGIRMLGRLFDAMLAKYTLDEERPHGLDAFTTNYFPEYDGYWKKVKVEIGFKEPIKPLSQYCVTDTDITLRGMIHTERIMMKMGFYPLFRSLLMMCSRVMAESEFTGAIINEPYVRELTKIYKKKIDEAEKACRNDKNILKFEINKRKQVVESEIKRLQLEIKEIERGNSVQKERMINGRRQKIANIMAGNFGEGKKKAYAPINFGSPKQLCELFYTAEYGLKWKIKDKTEKGNPSTAEDTIKKYEKQDKSGFVKKLLDWREVDHLNSTYIEGIFRVMDKYNRVHSNFHISGTVTGRLSSTEPNLQNIPRDTTAKDIKTMYVPPPGFLLLEVDYGQAELRVVAELSGDENLIDIFRRNYNVHVATACRMFSTIDKYDEVKSILKDPKHPKWLEWEKNKKKGKSLNFSILYLQGDEATAETLGCSVEEAAKFKKLWFKQFPGVHTWIKKQIKLAHKQGYVPNLFGRRRRLHEIDSPKQYLRAEAERQSVNAPIQATSGDFALFSEILIREKIITGEFPPDITQVYRVHDSMGLYVRPKDIHKVVPQIIKICDNPQTMKYFGFELKHVQMKVSPEVGINWASLVEYDSWANYEKLLITPEYKAIYPWYNHSLLK